MMRYAVRTLFLILAAGFAGAQAHAADNPQLTALFHSPTGTEPEQRTLKIGRLDIDVDIAGGIAQTRATVRFENPEHDPLEGEFVLDLPSGSVVNGYALDVEGRMVDGVLASRRKASLAYEARVRRGIDPGVAEVTRSNAFRTQVFPILPGKGRTIRLSFVTPLAPNENFVLPLSTVETVGTLSVSIKTSGQETPPRLVGPEGLNLQWTATAAGYEARASASAVAIAGPIEIGSLTRPPSVSLTRHSNGDVFFEIDDAAPATTDRAMHPRRLRVYWDHSLSRRDDDLARERELLKRYLDTVSPGIVDLVLFADHGPELQTFEAPTMADALDDVLARLEYGGATSVEDVLDAPLPSADVCLYFSDGTVSIDSSRIDRARCPLFAISSASDADRGFLSVLAKRSAGAYFDLRGTSLDNVIARLSGNAPRVVSVTAPDGRAIDYAVLPTEPERFRIVGPAPLSGEVIVTLASGTKRVRTYPTSRARIPTHDAAGALWAVGRVAELNSVERPNLDGIVALARRYSVATFATAFIVLESASDYASEGIEPPASLGDKELARYRNLRAQLDREKLNVQSKRLETVVTKWNELKSWWAADYPLRAKPMADEPERLPAFPPSPLMQGPLDEIPETTLITGSLIRGTNAVGVPVTGLSPGTGSAPEITVEIAPWNPDRPYLTALDAAGSSGFWIEFRTQERMYGSLPAFYLDVGEYLFRQGRSAEAIRVALNALELPADDSSTMTILADRMMRYGDEPRAFWLYERVKLLEPDRPQPLRNLALALADRADKAASRRNSVTERRRDYLRALELLNEVVTRTWNDSYDGIEMIALVEANRIIPRIVQLGVDELPIDDRLIASVDVDLRVVLEWDTDFTDIDLWIDEPGGERARFDHARTTMGGRLSNDMTQGYGPEEYLLRRAKGGTYAVRVNVFATDRLNPNGATNVRVHLYRAYNRPDQSVETLELELKRPPTGGDENPFLVGMFTVSPGMLMVQE